MGALKKQKSDNRQPRQQSHQTLALAAPVGGLGNQWIGQHSKPGGCRDEETDFRRAQSPLRQPDRPERQEHADGAEVGRVVKGQSRGRRAGRHRVRRPAPGA